MPKYASEIDAVRYAIQEALGALELYFGAEYVLPTVLQAVQYGHIALQALQKAFRDGFPSEPIGHTYQEALRQLNLLNIREKESRDKVGQYELLLEAGLDEGSMEKGKGKEKATKMDDTTSLEVAVGYLKDYNSHIQLPEGNHSFITELRNKLKTSYRSLYTAVSDNPDLLVNLQYQGDNEEFQGVFGDIQSMGSSNSEQATSKPSAKIKMGPRRSVQSILSRFKPLSKRMWSGKETASAATNATGEISVDQTGRSGQSSAGGSKHRAS